MGRNSNVGLFLAVLLPAGHAPAQQVTLGATVGLRLTADDPRYATSNSRRYLVGVSLEVGLPFRFAIGADALFSRLGNTSYIPLIANESDIRTIANAWQFPLMAKYRLPLHRASPFLSIGPGAAPRRRTDPHH